MSDDAASHARAREGVGVDVVPSPCVNLCTMDAATGLCLGCSRRLDEIAAWSTLDDAGKRRVWEQLPARRAMLAERQSKNRDTP